MGTGEFIQGVVTIESPETGVLFTHRRVRRYINIRIIQDHQRSIAAQLQRNAFDVFAAGRDPADIATDIG